MSSTIKRGKEEILICSQLFHRKPLNALYAYLFNFLFPRSMCAFTTYTPLCLILYKPNLSVKNISKRKYKKLRDHLFKEEIFLGKGLLVSKKGNFLSQKGSWVIKNSRCRSNAPSLEVVFDTFQSRKKFFFQKGLFLTNCRIPRRFIILK